MSKFSGVCGDWLVGDSITSSLVFCVCVGANPCGRPPVLRADPAQGKLERAGDHKGSPLHAFVSVIKILQI